MITEHQMKRLFVRANPIPKTGSAELDEVSATAYLATLEQRSSNMTQLDTKPKSRTGSEPKYKAVLVGAMAIVVFAGISLGIARLGGDETTGPPASADVAGTSAINDSDLVGKYRTDGGALIEISQDGTYVVEVFPGRVVIDQGTWSLDGSEFVWTTAADNENCAGAVGHYEVALGDEGAITMNVIGQDECPNRYLSFKEFPLLPNPS